MRYRCANDLFGYCDREPEWETSPIQHTLKGEPTFISIGTCKLDPETCGRYIPSHILDAEILAGAAKLEHHEPKHVRIIEDKSREEKTKEVIEQSQLGL